MKGALILSIVLLSGCYGILTQCDVVKAHYVFSGVIGPYLVIDYVSVEPLEARVNETITIEIQLLAKRTMLIKSANARIDTLDNSYQFTVAENKHVVKPPDTQAVEIRNSTSISPSEETHLHIFLSVEYEYEEDLQNITHEGYSYITYVTQVRQSTHSDLYLENYGLDQELSDLTNRYMVLESSYTTYQTSTYVLAVITSAIIVVTLLVALLQRRKSKVCT